MGGTSAACPSAPSSAVEGVLRGSEGEQLNIMTIFITHKSPKNRSTLMNIYRLAVTKTCHLLVITCNLIHTHDLDS